MVVCHINAALDRSAGLCSPVGLRDLLAQSFNNADQLLLEELKGGRLHLMAPSWHVPVHCLMMRRHAALSTRGHGRAACATGLDDEDERLAGSTATVALVRRDKIIVANVGDSRAVLCRNGRHVDLTTEHR